MRIKKYHYKWTLLSFTATLILFNSCGINDVDKSEKEIVADNSHTVIKGSPTYFTKDVIPIAFDVTREPGTWSGGEPYIVNGHGDSLAIATLQKDTVLQLVYNSKDLKDTINVTIKVGTRPGGPLKL